MGNSNPITFRSQMRTSPARQPDASMLRVDGWKATHHGVRGCPSNTCVHLPVCMSVTRIVWSPCVEAIRLLQVINKLIEPVHLCQLNVLISDCKYIYAYKSVAIYCDVLEYISGNNIFYMCCYCCTRNYCSVYTVKHNWDFWPYFMSKKTWALAHMWWVQAVICLTT